MFMCTHILPPGSGVRVVPLQGGGLGCPLGGRLSISKPEPGWFLAETLKAKEEPQTTTARIPEVSVLVNGEGQDLFSSGSGRWRGKLAVRASGPGVLAVLSHGAKWPAALLRWTAGLAILRLWEGLLAPLL